MKNGARQAILLLFCAFLYDFITLTRTEKAFETSLFVARAFRRGFSTPALRSALSLFVALALGANHHHSAVSLDHFALIAHRFYGRSYFHFIFSLMLLLCAAAFANGLHAYYALQNNFRPAFRILTRDVVLPASAARPPVGAQSDFSLSAELRFAPPGDSSLSQIVGTHFEFYGIAFDDSDIIHAKFSRNIRRDGVTVGKLYFECGVGQRFEHFALRFDYVVFGHKNFLR